MQKELIEFVKKNNLSPFNGNKTSIVLKEESFYKTKDAKLIHNKLISRISNNFNFSDSSNLFNFFEFTADAKKIMERQEFFRTIKLENNKFLKGIRKPKQWWHPNYGIMVVTEDDRTYNDLQKLGCPVKFLITQSDLQSLEEYDIVQVIEADNFSRALENLPQTVFLDSIDDVYLERYVQMLSGWSENINILDVNIKEGEIRTVIDEIKPLLELLDNGKKEKLKREDVEAALLSINKNISDKIKNMTLSGDSLYSMLSRNIIPDELSKIMHDSIRLSGMNSNLFSKTIPVEIEEQELSNLIKKQDTLEHTSIAVKIKKNSDKLRKLPSLLSRLGDLLILYDFTSGISEYIEKTRNFPQFSDVLQINESNNLFLDNSQAISFNLSNEHKCSILTGANSGGKTTLIEHIIQIYSLFQLGLPSPGEVKMPIFEEIYYFAKNKGSVSKGAFETLLTQMSKINPGNKTLILADEIESVTEPGVAGAIISASAEFFIGKGCFLVIATHLGKEIQKTLPKGARVDGIEAKGLDENYDLIVDHNPVLGRLANSTPELIIEKMASRYKSDYYNHLFDFVKKQR